MSDTAVITEVNYFVDWYDDVNDGIGAHVPDETHKVSFHARDGMIAVHDEDGNELMSGPKSQMKSIAEAILLACEFDVVED